MLAPPNADIEINRACAFGQKYSHLIDPKVNREISESVQAELTKARAGALASVQKSLALDPPSSVRLKELLWVSADAQDNDLSAFQSDTAFNALLPRT